MKSIRLTKIEAQRQARPAMADALLQAGRVNGPWLHIPEPALRAILAQHWPERLKELAPRSAEHRSAAPAEPALPTLPAMARNLAVAIARTAARAIQGKPIFANAAVQELRRAACQTCEHFCPSDQRCSKCGCSGKGGGLMPGKWRLEAEHCPLPAPHRRW